MGHHHSRNRFREGRRSRLWSPGGSGETLLDPSTLSPFAHFEADNVDTSGATVTNWPCKIDPGVNDLESVGADPVLVASEATLNGLPAVEFTVADSLQAATAASWKFLHDGTDWFCWMVLRLPLDTNAPDIFNTHGGTGANVGFGVDVHRTRKHVNAEYFNGGGGAIFFPKRTIDQAFTTSATILTMQYEDGVGLTIRLNGAIWFADAPNDTPSASNPFQALTIELGHKRFIGELGFIKSAQTAAGIRGVEAFLSNKYAIDLDAGYINLMWQTSSLGDPITSGDNFYSYLPDNLATLGLLRGNVAIKMHGLAGKTTTEAVAEEATRCDPFFDPYASRNIALLWEYVNSHEDDGLTNAQIQALYTTWAEDRHAAGFKTWVVGILPYLDVANETDRDAFNAWLEANEGPGELFDRVIRVYDDPDMGQSGDHADTTYYKVDEVHLNELGSAKIAGWLEEVFAEAFSDVDTLDVTSITPDEGSEAGGDAVVIAGTGFERDHVAAIDGTALSSKVFVHSKEIRGTTPPGDLGEVDISVENDTLAGGFTYEPAVSAPAISSLNYSQGHTGGGGQSIVITGTDMADAIEVLFGATAATITGNDATTVTVTLPAHAAGAVDVTVETAGGVSDPASFEFWDPSVEASCTNYAVPGTYAVAATGGEGTGTWAAEVGSDFVKDTVSVPDATNGCPNFEAGNADLLRSADTMGTLFNMTSAADAKGSVVFGITAESAVAGGTLDDESLIGDNGRGCVAAPFSDNGFAFAILCNTAGEKKATVACGVGAPHACIGRFASGVDISARVDDSGWTSTDLTAITHNHSAAPVCNMGTNWGNGSYFDGLIHCYAFFNVRISDAVGDKCHLWVAQLIGSPT